MKIIEKLALVAELFSGTFCRTFLVYGSNIIPLTPNSVDVAMNDNFGLFDDMTTYFNMDDTITPYLTPACPYAFSTIYEVSNCKFYMLSYWDFRVILAGVAKIVPALCFRYTTKYDKLCEYLSVNAKPRKDLLRTVTLCYGDCLSLVNDVSPWVEQFSVLSKGEIIELIQNRWLSLQDLPLSFLEEFDVTLSELDCNMMDLCHLCGELSVYGVAEIGIKVSSIIRAKNESMFSLFDRIDENSM